jgi:dihydroflavonol-4-reductase
MRIAVTGGTGFLGAHSVAALHAAGHQVRLLARGSVDAVTSLGVPADGVEVVPGDVTDPSAVGELLDGCDAVLHAAGVVGLDERDAARMQAVNVDGTRHILTQAVGLGLDPIVHVSSYSALFPSADPVIGPDSPTVQGRSAYGRTKAAADRIARDLQATGAPVVLTYPSTVLGPPAGGRQGIAAIGWDPLLRFGASITFDGGMVMVDVRDVAAVHVAVMEPGRGPRRFMCGGRMVGFDEILDLLQDASGRRIRRIRIPNRALLGIGRASDLATRVLPMAPLLSYEAAWLLTSRTPTDDSRTHDELGVQWRPIAETIAAAVRSGA